MPKFIWGNKSLMSAKTAQMLQMANSAHKGDKNSILAAINSTVASAKPLSKEDVVKQAQALQKERSGINQRVAHDLLSNASKPKVGDRIADLADFNEQL